MKILYLHQYFNTPNMAGGTRSYEMARRFVKKGHEVNMITSARSYTGTSPKWSNTNEDGINVFWCNVPYSNKMSFLSRIKAFIHFALQSSIKVGELDADIIFATSTPLTIIFPAYIAKKKLKVPLVFEVRDLWPELPIAIGAIKNEFLIFLAQMLEKFAYKNSECIITLSPGMKAGIELTGYPTKNIHIVPNSADIDLFNVPSEFGANFRRNNKWLGHKPLVVYCGTLGIINGVSYLVNLAKECKELMPELRFLIVGDGAENEKIQKKAIELGVLNVNLYMRNEVKKSEIVNILSAATIASSLFIDLKPMWNNSANKFFDATAAQKPIMINYGGWQAEILNQSRAGIVLPPNNIKESAQILMEFILDTEKLKIASQASGRLAVEKFDRNKLANKLLSILENVFLNSSK